MPMVLPTAAERESGSIPSYCADAKRAGLPAPTKTPPEEFERQLLRFLNGRVYAELGWCADKAINGNLVRDTGPYINNVYYGTHPAVRVYYSPKMMAWLLSDRSKPPQDGAVVVKEMFEPPAARYHGLNDAQVFEKLQSWTVMIRDAAGSADGWYWSNPVKGDMVPDSHAYPFAYPESGFGQYCIRCHSSATDFSTFAGTRNIKGFPGEPIRYRIDDSWREATIAEKAWQPHSELKQLKALRQYIHGPQGSPVGDAAPKQPVTPDPQFLQLYSAIEDPAYAEVKKFPGETHDRVVAPAGGAVGFITSDQCMTCHGGLNGNEGAAAGPVMFLQTGRGYGEGYNVSPYGEWRWSPMGLSGRDPIFHAQLDSEIVLLKRDFGRDPERAEKLVSHLENLCFSCHGVMGQRQLEEDAAKLGLDPLFKREYLFLTQEDRNNPYRKYGALARDGVSCLTCHTSKPIGDDDELSDLKSYLTEATTGRFAAGEDDETYGPFKDDEIVTLPMENALGLTPQYSAYIGSSRLCGSCHVVNLPDVGRSLEKHERSTLDDAQPAPAFAGFKHTLEQATYLEWLNSGYQNEYLSDNPTPERAQSCQGCHMPTGFKSADAEIVIEQLKTRIAAIQDETYPEADHVAPVDDIRVRFREKGYRRHRLQGLNAIMLQMFRQANHILGVRTGDYMTGADGLDLALAELAQQAKERTAELELEAARGADGKLRVDVEVTNKTGHRFPTGVGFRRAFLELLVIDSAKGRERVIWGSGRTNALGVIVDEKGRILPSEFFEPGPDGDQSYQRHHETITRQDQVQIYEELIRNAGGKFSTSFIRRSEHVKDNRLLPFGWTEKGPQPGRYAELKDFIHATHPGPDAARDDDYRSGEGRDIVRYEIALPADLKTEDLKVRATLYYQAIPPSWLRQRFTTAPDMPATKRLHYIASRLNLDGTPLEGWKLKLVSGTEKVAEEQEDNVIERSKKSVNN